MTRRMLHLFPDTNLFVQCRSLAELDWAKWGSIDEIHLHVCRPVQQEIDRHKREGNERLARRARAVASDFREIIKLGTYKVVRERKPRVVLLIERGPVPSPSLANQLDYSVVDDRIVGIVHSFTELNQGSDVRLLTHDTGPLLAAQEVGIAAETIPDEWLLPRIQSEEEKKIAKLTEELERLRRNEPNFLVRFSSNDYSGDGAFTGEFTRYVPLTGQDVSRLLKELKTKLPPARKPHPDQDLEFRRYLEARYEEYLEEYRGWLARCQSYLVDLHHILQTSQDPCINIEIENQGTRPGSDVLVRIKSAGNLQLRPHLKAIDAMGYLSLPSSPKFTRSDSDQDIMRKFGNSLRGLEPIPHTPPVAQREIDRLYWVPSYPDRPMRQLELACRRWQHGVRVETVVCKLETKGEEREVAGTLTCTIHADNLSEATENRIVVNLKARLTPSLDEAEALVHQLVNDESGLGRLEGENRESDTNSSRPSR